MKKAKKTKYIKNTELSGRLMERIMEAVRKELDGYIVPKEDVKWIILDAAIFTVFTCIAAAEIENESERAEKVLETMNSSIRTSMKMWRHQGAPQ